MDKDVRLYRRSTLVQLGVDVEILDDLEVTHETDKDGRFQLITDPARMQLPACSYISRTNDDPWFIDTGLEIDEGQLYIGRTDFEGLASVAGFVSVASIARVEVENERLKRELAVCYEFIGDLRKSLGDMVSLSAIDRTDERETTQRPSSSEPETQRAEADAEKLDLIVEE